MDISSAESFVMDDKFLLRSLIYIKKKRDPKMDSNQRRHITYDKLTEVGFHMSQKV